MALTRVIKGNLASVPAMAVLRVSTIAHPGVSIYYIYLYICSALLLKNRRCFKFSGGLSCYLAQTRMIKGDLASVLAMAVLGVSTIDCLGVLLPPQAKGGSSQVMVH